MNDMKATDKLISSWYHKVQTVPEDYVFPPEKRPGETNVSPGKNIPVIDMANDPKMVVQQTIEASRDFGFFQVINHGVAENLIDDTMKVIQEFFMLPPEDKSDLYSEDPSRSCVLYTSGVNYKTESVHYWRDNLRHPCHPLEECKQSWPKNPSRYRDVVGTYSVELRKLASRILALIAEGLELPLGYFDDKLSEMLLMSVNYYPPCPDPSLVLGVPKHGDPNLITILLQQHVSGLQVFKDGEWIGVEPLPHAFVINIGHQLQIISNERLKSAEHRAVTNSKEARISVAFFVNPSLDSTVHPADALINAANPPLYKAFQYKEFLRNYTAKAGDRDLALEPYRVR